jgi:ABC-type transport system involved in multi-copper enzyme maturation permease subunit
VHVLRANWFRLLLVAIGLAIWGAILPIVYDAFGQQFRSIMDSGIIPPQFAQFGGGDIFSLTGSVALGFIHPFAVALNMVFAVGFAGAAIAGERQRGTLEVLLARPLPRNGVLLTTGGALLLAVVVVFGALLAGMVVSAAMQGLLDDLSAEQLPLVILNGLLLWAAFLAFSLAASVSFDRAGPALGLSLAYLILNYFLEILGSLWTDAAWTQEYSLFHHFQPGEILAGDGDPMDLVILAVAVLIPLGYALIRFPRRDLAAPA